jgi:hypothetical protein
MIQTVGPSRTRCLQAANAVPTVPDTYHIPMRVGIARREQALKTPSKLKDSGSHWQERGDAVQSRDGLV